MREKVTDYLDKPNKKLFAQLTSMEQKYVDGQVEKPKAEKPKAEKPKP